MSLVSTNKLRFPTEDEAQLAAESRRKIAAIHGHDENAKLCLYDGDQKIIVPVAAIHLLEGILTHMAQGNAVTLVPIGHTLTTQQAADMLNVSRPYFVKLLESGKIEFTKVGRHRRIKYQDLLDYMKEVDKKSRQALDELAAQAQELGMGY